MSCYALNAYSLRTKLIIIAQTTGKINAESVVTMSDVIDQTTYYTIKEPTVWRGCCDTVQFQYYCKKHQEPMGCYFCDFNYDEECGCLTTAIAKGNG